MKAQDLLNSFRARMPEEFAKIAVQAMREDYGGTFERIPAPESHEVARRLERDSKIVALKAAGESTAVLAERFGLSERRVQEVIRGATSRN